MVVTFFFSCAEMRIQCNNLIVSVKVFDLMKKIFDQLKNLVYNSINSGVPKGVHMIIFH